MSKLVLATPVQDDIVEISCDQDWREAFKFNVFDTDGVTKLPRDFTGKHVIGGLAQKNGSARIDLTSTGGSPNLVISGQFVTTVVLRDTIKALPDGNYKFGLTEVDNTTGAEIALLEAVRKIDHGVLL